jgi:hypothetical protein
MCGLPYLYIYMYWGPGRWFIIRGVSKTNDPRESPEPRPGPYTVMVYDNYHYMDHDEAYRLGDFDTCEAAVAACKRMVDDFLHGEHKPGMPAGELWDIYTAFGDDPGILSPGDNCHFSAWDYARHRSEEICR